MSDKIKENIEGDVLKPSHKEGDRIEVEALFLRTIRDSNIILKSSKNSNEIYILGDYEYRYMYDFYADAKTDEAFVLKGIVDSVEAVKDHIFYKMAMFWDETIRKADAEAEKSGDDIALYHRKDIIRIKANIIDVVKYPGDDIFLYLALPEGRKIRFGPEDRKAIEEAVDCSPCLLMLPLTKSALPDQSEIAFKAEVSHIKRKKKGKQLCINYLLTDVVLDSSAEKPPVWDQEVLDFYKVYMRPLRNNGFERYDQDPEFKKRVDTGIEVEREHSANITVAAIIAMHHLEENEDYYVYLKEMEEKMTVKTGNKAHTKAIQLQNLQNIQYIWDQEYLKGLLQDELDAEAEYRSLKRIDGHFCIIAGQERGHYDLLKTYATGKIPENPHTPPEFTPERLAKLIKDEAEASKEYMNLAASVSPRFLKLSREEGQHHDFLVKLSQRKHLF